MVLVGEGGLFAGVALVGEGVGLFTCVSLVGELGELHHSSTRAVNEEQDLGEEDEFLTCNEHSMLWLKECQWKGNGVLL